MPGLIELTVGQTGENVVEHVGCEDSSTARDEQWSPVLLEKHRELEETRCHRVVLMLNFSLEQQLSVRDICEGEKSFISHHIGQIDYLSAAPLRSSNKERSMQKLDVA